MAKLGPRLDAENASLAEARSLRLGEEEALARLRVERDRTESRLAGQCKRREEEDKRWADTQRDALAAATKLEHKLANSRDKLDRVNAERKAAADAARMLRQECAQRAADLVALEQRVAAAREELGWKLKAVGVQHLFVVVCVCSIVALTPVCIVYHRR